MILYDKILIGILLGGALLLLFVTEVARKYINNEWRALYFPDHRGFRTSDAGSLHRDGAFVGRSD